MKRALLLGIVMAIAAPAGAARAGTFVVQACGASGVDNAWHATAPPAGVMEVNETCHADPQMDGIWVRDVLASSSDLTDGQGAWLQLDAPTGTTITAITYKRWLWKDSIDDLHPELRTADGTVLETCSIPYGSTRCDLGGEGTAAVTYSGLSTTRLQAGVRCQVTAPYTSCPGGGTEHGYGAVITDAAVTIEDDTPPAAPAVADSGLWSGAAWYRGRSSITVSGADASGIAAVRLYADGQLLAQQALTCDYTRPKPCPDASDLNVTVDTAQLSDGEHAIAVALVDPAGNESGRVDRDVLIANEAPAAPQLTLTPSSSSSPEFTASWTPAAGHALPIALAHVIVCHDLACSHTTSTASSVQLSAPGPGTTTVAVYLQDLAGNADPANATSANFTLNPPATTPILPAGPGVSSASSTGGHRSAKAPPRLTMALAPIFSRLRVRVRTDRRASGSVLVAIRWQLGRDPAKRRWSRVYRRRAPIRDGRAALTVKRPAQAGLVRVAVSYGGNMTFAAARVRRALRLQ